MNLRELFGNISGTYDLLNRVLSFGTDRRWRKQGVAFLPHGPKTRVLDLACGTLDLALQYLDQGLGEVYAIDFALPMLFTGRAKVSPTLDPRLHLVCGDGLTLPFEDRSFDAGMCAWGMRNLSDISKGLKEISRVLKPGSPFLILEFFRPSNIFSKLFAKTYGRHILPNVGKWISKDSQAYEYLHRSVQGFFSRKEFEGVLQDHGFQLRQSKDLNKGIASMLLAIKHD